jgi:hypothetical protein
MEETDRFDTGDLTRPVDPRAREGERARWLGALVVAALVIGAIAAWYAWMRRAETPPPAPPVAAAPAAPAVAPQPNLAPPVRHPVEAIAPPTAETAKPLPALAESDPAAADALSTLLPGGTFQALFYPDRVIRRFVATVDNLPRQTLAADLRPVRPAPGGFAVIGPPDARQIGLDNGSRYNAYVRALTSADSKQLVATYVRFYPLFQQAYRELGYPNGYFNDRLVDVIDDLLAAPNVDGAVALTQPKVLYEYADPALQSLSSGQKVMVRMGPENEAKVKAKLREIRRLLAAQKPAS